MNKKKDSPLVPQLELSVVIVNLNGWFYLEPLIKSIQKTHLSKYEIIIVDNGSTNNEVDPIKDLVSRSKNIKLIQLNLNYGPATARNIGVRNSSGKYISFLDNDTVVDKYWSREAISYFDSHKKVGIIQCKLLLESDHSKIDYVGEFLGDNGFLVQECKAGDTDTNQFNHPKKILAAKSAGMFIRRNVFNKIGGFDDSYFIYVEETDLGWRTWLAGYEVHYLPSSIVYHHFGTSTVILGLDKASGLAKYHGPKNYINTLIKNLSLQKIIVILPIHISLWFGLIVYRLLVFKPQDSLYMLRGIFWVLINITNILRNRSAIQKYRVRSDEYIFKHLVVRRSLWYLISKATKTTTVGNAKSY